VYVTNHPIFILCTPDLEADSPAKEQLLRPYFHDPEYTWPDDTSVEFHLTHGATIELLRSAGFEVERLVELQAPEQPRQGGGGALPNEEVPFGMATRAWARQWPTEEVWVARKRG
jgi:hypothetical protein